MNQVTQLNIATHQLDVSGLGCPLPVLKTKAALARIAPGEQLEVIGTNPDSVVEIKSLCRMPGVELESITEEEGRFIYLIRKST